LSTVKGNRNRTWRGILGEDAKSRWSVSKK
jgi:hypothetical protein